jgi:glycosyltransferase involved in cell wall biosynthesis
MACGRPVVVSDLPSVREWLGDMAPWALVPVGDADRTASAIKTALGLDAATRRQLADRLRGVVVARADRERQMLEAESTYRRLAGR